MKRQTDILNVNESVHRDIITKTTNKMLLCRLIYYSLSALRVSGDVFAHHQEHLTVCKVLVSWMRWNRVPTHPWQQPAATLVNITRCCKYSQVLLMMGENIAQNTYS